MRLIAAAAAFAALVLLIACGGGDSPSTATPSPSPTEGAFAPGQQTPNPDACTPDVLKGTLVSTQPRDDVTLLTLEVVNTNRDCVFDGPPELRWYGVDGNGLGVPFTPAAACESDAAEYDECVYQDPIDLPDPDFNLPIGTSYKIRAIVSVTDADSLIPCASPNKQAHFVGLQFPGVTLDVQIELPDDIEMQTCSAQVNLASYGPVLTGSD